MRYATYAMALENSDKFFCVYSKTDNWVDYSMIYSLYDPVTMKKEDITSKIVAEDADLASSIVYGISEGKNGSFYIMTTKYSADNGKVYHFNSDFKLVGKFTSWGQNPKKVVLMD